MSLNNSSLFNSAHWYSCACDPNRWNLGTITAKCPVCGSAQHYTNTPAMLRLVDAASRDADRRDWLESLEALAAVTRAADDVLPGVMNRLPSWLEALWSVPQFRGSPCSSLNLVRMAFSHPSTAFVGVLIHQSMDAAELEVWAEDPLRAAVTEHLSPITPRVSLTIGESVEDMLRFSGMDLDNGAGLVYDLKRGKLSKLAKAMTVTDIED